MLEKSQSNKNNRDAQPFVKWVGGKRSILNILLENTPKQYNRYIESFLGGGALFFALQPENAYLSDINLRLIITYQAIRDDVEGVIHLLEIHKNNHNKDYFYKAREKLSLVKNPVEIAALFIYLNKTCYNGLYRVNRNGKFNVPIGKYENPAILDVKNLYNVSKVLKKAVIQQGNFSIIQPQKNDFFYIDPPYHQTYTMYNKDGFTDSNQEELANYCKLINANGGYFMVSNTDDDFIRDLYKGFHFKQVMALRSVSSKSYQRKKENELLITNYE